MFFYSYLIAGPSTVYLDSSRTLYQVKSFEDMTNYFSLNSLQMLHILKALFHRR